MEQLSNHLFNALLKASATYKVSPPERNMSLLDWWRVAVTEMRPIDIKLLYLAFQVSDEAIFRKEFPEMRRIIEARQLQLDI